MSKQTKETERKVKIRKVKRDNDSNEHANGTLHTTVVIKSKLILITKFINKYNIYI